LIFKVPAEGECAWCRKLGNEGQRLRKCTKCSSVSYCSQECQAKHWKQGRHRKACKAGPLGEDTTATKEAPGSIRGNKKIRSAECETNNKQATILFKDVLRGLSQRGDRWAHQAIPKERHDLTKAVELWKLAADLGHPLADFHLGHCFELGFNPGCVHDPCFEEAFKYFKKAADTGLDVAQRKVGIMYKVGCGVAQDPVAAFDWLQKAAQQGDAEAEYRLSSLYETDEAGQEAGGGGVAANPTLALEWLKKAADQGLQVAQLRLGVCCAVEKDLVGATKWFKNSSASNDDPNVTHLAQDLLKKLASSEW
jgi:TPR repeat protein